MPPDESRRATRDGPFRSPSRFIGIPENSSCDRLPTQVTQQRDFTPTTPEHRAHRRVASGVSPDVEGARPAARDNRSN